MSEFQANQIFTVPKEHLSLLQALERDDNQWFIKNPRETYRIRPVMEEEVPENLRNMNYVIVHRPQGSGIRQLEFFEVPREMLKYISSITYDYTSGCPQWTFVEGQEKFALETLKRIGREGELVYYDDERPAEPKLKDYLDFQDFDC